MTALLVLFTAIVFLLAEHFYSRYRVVQPAVTAVPVVPLKPRLLPQMVGGFEVPFNLRYHPGHSWALAESPNLVRAGFDQFTARLFGHIEKIQLPRRGQWVRQGQKIWTLRSNGRTLEMASPIEGVVTDINDSVLANPDLARRDPYGEGWLLKVESPDSATNFRNLLGGNLVRRWMEEAVRLLRHRLPAPAGAVAQDGGMAVDDIGSQISDEEWSDLVGELYPR